jgi:hypothetical protein
VKDACFFQNYPGKLYQRSTDAEHAGKNMNIEAGFIKNISKKKIPFFYEAEIFVETEIGKRIVDEQQAKKSNGEPEQHLEEKSH